MKRRISADARRDIATVLDWSDARFGLTARIRYENLIERGLTAVTQDADSLGSLTAGDGTGQPRVYHLRHCRAVPDNLTVGRHGVLSSIGGYPPTKS